MVALALGPCLAPLPLPLPLSFQDHLNPAAFSSAKALALYLPVITVWMFRRSRLWAVEMPINRVPEVLSRLSMASHSGISGSARIKTGLGQTTLSREHPGFFGSIDGDALQKPPYIKEFLAGFAGFPSPVP